MCSVPVWPKLADLEPLFVGVIQIQQNRQLAVAEVPWGLHVQEINVVVDASNVPFNYITTVLENCDVFPHELVFFLEGQFEVCE